jgi:DNA modification methylase|tara:strand:- start:336 stop:506 length:171 start_codon:yes stop_codon:yes gene_type:complete
MGNIKLIHGDCLEKMKDIPDTNRRFIGIELDEKYFKIAKERINSHKSSQTEKKNGN